jgi:glycosyltransferase involved in cell wall biosynthesis
MVSAESDYIAVGGRFMSKNVTGVQRYAREIVKRLKAICRIIEPGAMSDGGRGHLWEQAVLPVLCRGRVLWSPCNTGPLAVRRQVVTVHDAAFIDHPECFSRNFSRWYGWLVPRLMRRAHSVITVSEHARSRLSDVAGIDPRRIHVVPNGVDPRFAPVDPEKMVEASRRYGITGGYILGVGSLEPRKNLAGLLRAWAMVAPRHSDLTLALAGKPGISCFSKLGLPPAVPRVKWLGYVSDEDLPSLYAGARAFVFPSIYEGFGLPPLEAMACGTPVVCSGTTSLPEVVADAALQVNPHDIDSIADGILKVVEDGALRTELCRRGRARAKRYNWDDTASATRAILEKAAQTG